VDTRRRLFFMVLQNRGVKCGIVAGGIIKVTKRTSLRKEPQAALRPESDDDIHTPEKGETMIYEMRTYTLKPGTVSEFESRFAERHPYREKHPGWEDSGTPNSAL